MAPSVPAWQKPVNARGSIPGARGGEGEHAAEGADVLHDLDRALTRRGLVLRGAAGIVAASIV
jgi:hypothetical protein